MSSEQIANAVKAYVELVGSGTAEQVVDLYADSATVEDPIGSDIKSTREALLEFYGVIAQLERSTELKWMRIAGDTAVFEFSLVTAAGDAKFEVTPVDIMRFDDEGRVVSMRAVWDPASDLKQI
ncbi:steroid delta-isomerase [Williamsia sp. Leaf354]|uniref:Nuclear transport factor 2 family protein n=1 Tax=Williamsia herbipolensis TaxID=1603258 RepID=A0AAU4JXP8_9NOCA|nr:MULTISPECIES: nuclear transport factor 2 family protein [Williamsia]KQR99592.1 steroid delta-isomerase [Williamsia sp. Leaf354]